MTDNHAGLGAWLVRLLFLVSVVAPAFGQDGAAAPQPAEEGTHGTEPSTWLLLATGLAIILLFRFHRLRRRLPPKPQPMVRGRPRAPATSPSSR